MEIIFSSIKWQFALVLLDNVVIFLQKPREHINHSRLVLGFLKKAGVSFKVKCCARFTKTIDSLGHIILPGKLEAANHTTDALQSLKTPTTQTEFRSYIRLSNLASRFAPKFARIAVSITARPRKEQAKTLGQLSYEKLTALCTLKEKLISPSILVLQR